MTSCTDVLIPLTLDGVPTAPWRCRSAPIVCAWTSACGETVMVRTTCGTFSLPLSEVVAAPCVHAALRHRSATILYANFVAMFVYMRCRTHLPLALTTSAATELIVPLQWSAELCFSPAQLVSASARCARELALLASLPAGAPHAPGARRRAFLARALAESGDCPICMQSTAGVYPPCGHAVCATCYYSLVRPTRHGHAACFACPVCRHVCPPQEVCAVTSVVEPTRSVVTVVPQLTAHYGSVHAMAHSHAAHARLRAVLGSRAHGLRCTTFDSLYKQGAQAAGAVMVDVMEAAPEDAAAAVQAARSLALRVGSVPLIVLTAE